MIPASRKRKRLPRFTTFVCVPRFTTFVRVSPLIQFVAFLVLLFRSTGMAKCEDFFGRNVIMAARVASQAQGGEILASGVVKALVEGSDVVWGDKRIVELKGLSGDHEIWPVQWAE